MAVWLLVLCLLGSLLYVNQVGLPGFIKNPVLAKLRARGLDLQFSRLRLRWYEGIVAENVVFGRADEPFSPRLTLGEVQVPLNFKALARLQLQVDALMLRRGRLVWPLAETNSGPQELAIENIHTDLRFLPGDQWSLDNFRAAFAGADIRLSGSVTNASAIREWEFLRRGAAAPTPSEAWQARLRRLSDLLQAIRFSAPPDLLLDVRGDARDLQSFTVRLHVAAPGADTPWGTVSGGHFSGRVFPAASRGPARAEFSVEAANAQTRWGAITNFLLSVQLRTVESQSNLVNAVLNLSADQVQTRWAAGTNLLLSAKWVHELTNAMPLMGECQVGCAQVRTKWGSAGKVQFSTEAVPVPNHQSTGDPSWGWWTNLQPYQLKWNGCVTKLESPKVVVDEITGSGRWSAPQLEVATLQARLYNGTVTGDARVNIATRALNAQVASNFDPHQIEPVLNEAGRRWLEQFAWDESPKIQAEISAILPAWTDRQPDWRNQVQPTLALHGNFSLPSGGAYYASAHPAQTPVALRFTNARSQFNYSNLCWHLPDLTLMRPEGGVVAEHRADQRTGNFYWHVVSTVDPGIVRPLLETGAQRALDYFALTQPPRLDAELWGRFHDPDQIGFRGNVSLTNFAFRGEAISSVTTALQYSNRVLQLLAPRVLCGLRQARADGLAVDFDRQLMFLTNGFSTADPLVVARAIGPHIARAIESYLFIEPPIAQVFGTIPLRGEQDADLHFHLEGGPFQWWKFKVPHLSGDVHWLGDSLTLTNIDAAFYQGKAVGSAEFDFRPGTGANFRFRLGTTNVLFPALMADLSGKTNRLDGRLAGNLVITGANTADWRTANGRGDLNLRDGLLWDIPVFGIFSPVLNSIAPGLGNSRATAAACSFVVNNGVCRTDNLEIRSSAMRLDYRGAVDLDGDVNARVEAELLRDMWLVGPVVSTIFWPVSKMFEYKVTGALHDPKMDPVFIIPRLVLFPFHPFRTLKGLLPEDSGPPQFAPPPP